MADYQVIAVRKPERSSRVEHITHLGISTATGMSIQPRENLIAWIRSQEHRFFTSVNGATAWLFVVENVPPPMQPYLRTTTDHTKIDNLLQLPPC